MQEGELSSDGPSDKEPMMIAVHKAMGKNKKCTEEASKNHIWLNKVHVMNRDTVEPISPRMMINYPFFPRSAIWGVAGSRPATGTTFSHYQAKDFVTYGTSICERLRREGVGFVCQRGKKEKTKPNQDDFFVIRGPRWGLYGVMDGHGPEGHMVASIVSRVLATIIVDHPNFQDNPPKALRDSFQKLQEILNASQSKAKSEIKPSEETEDVLAWTASMVNELNLNASLSGAAVVVALHDLSKNQLHMAHVGDCRGLVAVCSSNKALSGPLSFFCDSNSKITVPLETEDHKPQRSSEKLRVEESGGEVRLADNYHGLRVFAKGLPVPGYAMTRAIGDVAAIRIGIIAEPDVVSIDVPKGKELVLFLSSDGVVEFLDQKEITNVLCKAGKHAVNDAVVEVVESAKHSWKENQGKLAEIDDMTAVAVWVQYAANSSGSPWNCWSC